MIRVSAMGLLLRHERSDLAAVGLVALLVAGTACVLATGVRLFERAADDGLRHQVAAAPVVQRTIQLVSVRSMFGPEAGRTVGDWQADGALLRGLFPDAVRAVAGDGSLAVGSVRLSVANPPDYPIFVTLRYQDGLEDMADLVAGRWPAPTGAFLPPVLELPTGGGTDGASPPMPTDHAGDQPRRFEIAMLESSARGLGLAIGSRLAVNVSLTDPTLRTSILRDVPIRLAPTELVIAGLYRVRDPRSDAWFGDTRLRLDDLGTSLVDPVATITAYVPPEALPGLETSGLPFEYRWRYPVLAERFDADAVDESERGLRRLESRFASTIGGEDIALQAGLLPLLEQHRTRRAASEAVLAVAASGLVALAVGGIAVAVSLLAHRRRAALALARARGASGRMLLAVGLVEAVLVAAVACLGGLGVATAIVPGVGLGPSLAAAAATGLVAVGLLMGSTWRMAHRSLGELERAERPAAQPDPRRLVAELTLAALAVAGAYLLRQRGIAASGGPASSSSEPGASAGFDPFLAAVPPLIGLAAGIAIVRLYPRSMALAGWAAARRRDLVPVLGVRTVVRRATSSLPLLVLVLAAAFAAFASILSTSLDRAQLAASWSEVGADVRVEPAGGQRELPAGFDPAAEPGVDAVAVGLVEASTRLRAGPTRLATITLVAVDAAGYERVAASSPAQAAWPPAFLAPPTAGPVPAIVSGRLSGGDLGLAVGTTFDVVAAGKSVKMQVVEVRPAFPALGERDWFVVVPLGWLEQALAKDVRPSVMWVRAPPRVADALAASEEAEAGSITLVSRYDAYATLHDEPLLGAVGAGFALALVVAVAYAALTIVGTLLLSAGRRTRDLAVLRTLGLTSRQASRLTLVEHGPPVVVALLPGLALGIAVAFIVAPGLDLGAFTGSRGEVPLSIDWPALLAVSATLVVISLAAVAVGTWLSGRAAIVNALRIGDD